MISTDKIAVVILNWNGCEMMRQFLPSCIYLSLSGFGYRADKWFQTDDSLTMLAQEFPSVVFAKVKRKLWFCRGLQPGFKAD